MSDRIGVGTLLIWTNRAKDRTEVGIVIRKYLDFFYIKFIIPVLNTHHISVFSSRAIEDLLYDVYP